MDMAEMMLMRLQGGAGEARQEEHIRKGIRREGERMESVKDGKGSAWKASRTGRGVQGVAKALPLHNVTL